MKILIHAGKGEKTAEDLERQIQDRIPGTSILRSQDPDGLAGKLGRPLNNISVLIVFIQAPEALNNLFPLQHFFDNKKLILVLACRNSRMVAQGLELNPSFITTTDEKDELLMVLERIYRRHNTINPINIHINQEEEK